MRILEKLGGMFRRTQPNISPEEAMRRVFMRASQRAESDREEGKQGIPYLNAPFIAAMERKRAEIDADEFQEFLKGASAKVAGWPAWKQAIIDADQEMPDDYFSIAPSEQHTDK